jgi:ubiquitin-protein ligase E3 C
MFSPLELARLIAGAERIDLEDLRRHTQYSNGFHARHETVQYFWQALESFTPEQQRKFLQFVTGSSTVPLLGFADLQPHFCIQLAHVGPEEANNLPTASTCMNLLKLHPFSDPFLLKEKLLYAVENCASFDLS